MKFPAFAIAAALSSAVIPAAASAATFMITYTGIVANGFDETGVFGTAGQDLTGLAFSSVYTLIAPTPGAFVLGNGTFSSTYGGTDYGAPSPISGSITINGVTQSVAGSFVGIASQENSFGTTNGFDSVFHEAQDGSINGAEETSNYVYNIVNSGVNNIVNSSSYASNLSYAIQDGDSAGGGFQFFTGDISIGVGPVNAFGTLTPQTVNISEAEAAVPEPATWALFLLGFGAIGAMSRRKAVARVRYTFT